MCVLDVQSPVDFPCQYCPTPPPHLSNKSLAQHTPTQQRASDMIRPVLRHSFMYTKYAEGVSKPVCCTSKKLWLTIQFSKCTWTFEKELRKKLCGLQNDVMQLELGLYHFKLQKEIACLNILPYKDHPVLIKLACLAERLKYSLPFSIDMLLFIFNVQTSFPSVRSFKYVNITSWMTWYSLFVCRICMIFQILSGFQPQWNPTL